MGAIYQDKRVNISLTGGRSPKTLYKMMVSKVKNQEKFKEIQYYLFDDSPYNGEAHGLNWKEMQELFFQPANIPEERVHITMLNNWETFAQVIADGAVAALIDPKDYPRL